MAESRSVAEEQGAENVRLNVVEPYELVNFAVSNDFYLGAMTLHLSIHHWL